MILPMKVTWIFDIWYQDYHIFHDKNIFSESKKKIPLADIKINRNIGIGYKN